MTKPRRLCTMKRKYKHIRDRLQKQLLRAVKKFMHSNDISEAKITRICIESTKYSTAISVTISAAEESTICMLKIPFSEPASFREDERDMWYFDKFVCNTKLPKDNLFKNLFISFPDYDTEVPLHTLFPYKINDVIRA